MFAPWVEQAGRTYQMPQLTVTGCPYHNDYGGVGNGKTTMIMVPKNLMNLFPVFGICALVGAALAVWLPETQGR